MDKEDKDIIDKQIVWQKLNKKSLEYYDERFALMLKLGINFNEADKIITRNTK